MNFSNIKKEFTLVLGFICTFAVGVLLGLYLSSTKQVTAPNGNELVLQNIKVAWIPESEQIALIDRNTNTVTIMMSKEVTTAVFSLKASAIQQEFTSVTKGGVTQKRSTNSP